MFLLNSRHGSFTAPAVKPRDPFSRSYGASVPSSLTRFLSRALVEFTFLPVSVLVRIPIKSLEVFLVGLAQATLPGVATLLSLSFQL
jgi:hypothetical protein